MVKYSLSLLLLLGFVTGTESVQAQWSVGAGYELREVDPPNGVNFRIQKEILRFIPLVHLSVRSHVSYFSKNRSYDESSSDEFRAQQSYAVGVETLGGLSVGITKPYVGIGIGFSNTEHQYEGEEAGNNFTEENLVLNGFLGAEISIIPFLNPFIEYKFSQLTGTENLEYNSAGSISLGLMLSF